MTASKESLEGPGKDRGPEVDKLSKKIEEPEAAESNMTQLQGILDIAERAKGILDKNPQAAHEAEGLIVQVILELYRLPMVRRAEIAWNNRSDRSKNFLLGKGVLGKLGNTNPAVGALQTLTVMLVDAGILEPPTGMDMDKAAARSVFMMNALDKTSPVWGQMLLLFGPEAEVVVPVLVKIVHIMAFFNKNYQAVMKESRAVVAEERLEVQRSLATAETLDAEPTSFVMGQTHGDVEGDLDQAL